MVENLISIFSIFEFGNPIASFFFRVQMVKVLSNKRIERKKKKYTNQSDQDKLFQTFYNITNNNEETFQEHQFANEDGELLNSV